MPMIIPNVVRGSLVISESGCKFLGFMLIASIASSFLNLAYIAVQRYVWRNCYWFGDFVTGNSLTIWQDYNIKIQHSVVMMKKNPLFGI